MKSLFGQRSKKIGKKTGESEDAIDGNKTTVKMAYNLSSSTAFKANALVERKVHSTLGAGSEKNSVRQNHILDSYPIDGDVTPLATVVSSYGCQLSPSEVDHRLSPVFQDALDFLANEGLNNPELFRNFDPQQKVCDLLRKMAMKNSQIDFIKTNSISLAASVFMQCLLWFNIPIFPVKLLDLLAEIQLKTGDNADKMAAEFKNALKSSGSESGLSPHLVNVLGLFNLILLYYDSNKVSLTILTQMFAPFLIEGRASASNWRERIPKAESVLQALIANINQIFPIDVRLLLVAATPFASTYHPDLLIA
jgi:hypothetical protein